MKTTKKFTALTIMCLVSLPINIFGWGWAGAAEKAPEAKTESKIDVADVMNKNNKLTPEKLLINQRYAEFLLKSQKSAPQDASNKKASSIESNSIATDNTFSIATDNTLKGLTDVNNDSSFGQEDSYESPPAQEVTPSAFLVATLQESHSFQEAFKRLNKQINNREEYSPSQTLLAQQAQTLLVRAHPEVVPGLAQSLQLLPNRFMSYFKEKLPTLTTSAGRERFTQSVVMEALKASNYNPIVLDIKKLDFDQQLDTVTKKYAQELETSTGTQQFLQWSRNIITEIALLPFRTTAAVVGGGLVAATGSLIGVVHGAAEGGRAGSLGGTGKLSEALEITRPPRNPDLRNAQYATRIGGAIVGTVAGTPAQLVELGSPVGAVTGAATGAAVGGAGGAVIGGLYGAAVGTSLVNHAAQSVGKRIQSAYDATFTRKNNALTEADIARQNTNNGESLMNTARQSTNNAESDTSSETYSYNYENANN